MGQLYHSSMRSCLGLKNNSETSMVFWDVDILEGFSPISLPNLNPCDNLKKPSPWLVPQ